MPDPKFESTYTGQQVESAIGKALPLDDFALGSDEVISGTVYHVLWKVAPTASNTVSGIAIHPGSGKLYDVLSVNGTKTLNKYISEDDHITESEIESLLQSASSAQS